MKVWLDGRVIDESEARLSPLDRGFLAGDGVVETLLAQGGKPLRLAAHLARLHGAAATLGIAHPYSERELGEAMARLLAAGGRAEALVHIVLSRGTLGAERPTLLIATSDAPQPRALKVVVATQTRRNEMSPAARHATLSQVDTVIARREAAARGADEALLLNTQGRLAEATIGNVFLVVDGDVLTPPIAEGAQPGVMRAEVIERLGAATAQLNPADLASASEIFLTDAAGVHGVIAVDGKMLGNGREGPITQRLKSQVSQ